MIHLGNVSNVGQALLVAMMGIPALQMGMAWIGTHLNKRKFKK